VNITGDSAVTCIVAKSEGQLSSETFYGDGAPQSRPA
jgi:Na+/H+-dicarboxylate symporter